jgi:hypothetical protein
MQQQSIIIIPSQKKDHLKKNRLHAVIQKKRVLLQELVARTEMLKVNLEIAKQEYMVRIGSLFLKDSQLDFEIIRLKNILLLIDKGYTFDEAASKIAKSYYAQQLEFEREQEQLRYEEKVYQKQKEQTVQSINDLKQIWKRLIVKFHPDLIQDQSEKKKREAIMKQINRAYQEGNYDQLVKIEHENMVVQEMTIDNLEDILTRILNEITEQNEVYSVLKKSEWYAWMIKIEKAKKKSIDIFAETERRLLDDIVAKFAIIKKLSLKIQNNSKISI